LCLECSFETLLDRLKPILSRSGVIFIRQRTASSKRLGAPSEITRLRLAPA